MITSYAKAADLIGECANRWGIMSSLLAREASETLFPPGEEMTLKEARNLLRHETEGDDRRMYVRRMLGAYGAVFYPNYALRARVSNTRKPIRLPGPVGTLWRLGGAHHCARHGHLRLLLRELYELYPWMPPGLIPQFYLDAGGDGASGVRVLTAMVCDSGRDVKTLCRRVYEVPDHHARHPEGRKLIEAGALGAVVVTYSDAKAAAVLDALARKRPDDVRVQVSVVPELERLVYRKGV